MGANPHANGGILLRELRMPDFRDYAVECPTPGGTVGEATKVLGDFLRDIMKLNLDAKNFRVFAPDELASNRLGAILEVTDRMWMRRHPPGGRPPGSGRAGHGDPQRAHLPGLARGLSADRATRLVHDVRGFRPHRRLDVQPAREVAEDTRPSRVAARRSLR